MFIVLLVFMSAKDIVCTNDGFFAYVYFHIRVYWSINGSMVVVVGTHILVLLVEYVLFCVTIFDGLSCYRGTSCYVFWVCRRSHKVFLVKFLSSCQILVNAMGAFLFEYVRAKNR